MAADGGWMVWRCCVTVSFWGLIMEQGPLHLQQVRFNHMGLGRLISFPPSPPLSLSVQQQKFYITVIEDLTQVIITYEIY